MAESSSRGAGATAHVEALTLQHLSTLELRQLLMVRGMKTESNDKAELLRLLAKTMKQELPKESLWVAAPGESRRRGASVVAYKGSLFQFGGVDLEGTVYNTVHKWTPDDGWSLMDTRGVAPAPRWTHTAVEYQGGMYVFGGFYGFGGEGPTGRYNDLHRLDLERMTWTKVTIHGRSPSVRSHHSAIVLQDKMYIFGGADEERVEEKGPENFASELLKTFNVAEAEYRDVMHNDLHEFDFLTCTWRVVEVTPLSPFPPPTGGITARLAVHNDLLYVLGWRAARDTDLSKHVFEGQILEVHYIDVLTPPKPGKTRAESLPAWQRVQCKGTPPDPRDLFSTAVWKDKWIMHGGRSVRGDLLRDTFEFSFTKRAWKQLVCKSMGQNVPDLRYSHQALVVQDVLYVVGGSNSAQYTTSNKYLSQRCSGVEMLYLDRPVEPSADYVPAAPQAEEEKPKELTWRRNIMNWLLYLSGLFNGKSSPGSKDRRATGRKITVSDVNLVVGGRVFHAHSDVLGGNSEQFADILSRDPLSMAVERSVAPLRALQEMVARKGSPSAVVAMYYLMLLATAIATIIIAAKLRLFQNQPRTIVVKDLSYEVMLIMMHFMYAGPGEIPGIPNNRLEEAFHASERYGVDSLRAESLRCMMHTITTATVSQYSLLAHEHACQELWDACVSFCSNRLPEIVRTEGFELLWSINPRVAQMLTADAARELQLSTTGAAQRAAAEKVASKLKLSEVDAEAESRTRRMEARIVDSETGSERSAPRRRREENKGPLPSLEELQKQVDQMGRAVGTQVDQMGRAVGTHVDHVGRHMDSMGRAVGDFIAAPFKPTKKESNVARHVKASPGGSRERAERAERADRADRAER